ncbi:DUF222 domain-containing protein [Nakamurella aerolata]|uniref:DUF222 domain-containing protein n=1 Tax=Nakamurella aerolata TaxID=1656892 RepID=A0A849ABB0_9ACTN|nr:DUF222 domain-containing protein [Nakamurella aerolata]
MPVPAPSTDADPGQDNADSGDADSGRPDAAARSADTDSANGAADAGVAGVVLHGNVLLDSVVARERVIWHLQALNAADLGELARSYVGVREFLDTEVAGALIISERAAATQITIAEQLRKLPVTWAAWNAGEIDLPKVRYLAEQVEHLDEATARRLEERIYPSAVGRPMGLFRRQVRRVLLGLSPDHARESHEKAVAQRGVSCVPGEDGMAQLVYYGPAQEVEVVWRVLTVMADTAKTPDDPRGIDARRADCLVDLFHHVVEQGLPGGAQLTARQRSRVRLQVTMPYTVLTGGIEVCELDGYGPITAAQARTILARTHTGTQTSAGMGGREVNQGNNNGSARRPGSDGRAGRRPDPSDQPGRSDQAGRKPGPSEGPGRRPDVSSETSRRPGTPHGTDSRPSGSGQRSNKATGSATGSRSDLGCDLLVQRLVCDPLDGSLLDATRIAGYVPPEWLAEQIRTRDRTCVAPGCRQPAARTEIDHRVPYQAGGATSADNLNLLCKHHHRAKDGGGWTLTRTAGGSYHWTSPLGRTHTREPETWWQPTGPASDPGGRSAAALSQAADRSATRGTPSESVASEQEAGEQMGGTRDSSDQGPATICPAESLAPQSDQAEPGAPDQNDDLPPF